MLFRSCIMIIRNFLSEVFWFFLVYKIDLLGN